VRRWSDVGIECVCVAAVDYFFVRDMPSSKRDSVEKALFVMTSSFVGKPVNRKSKTRLFNKVEDLLNAAVSCSVYRR